MVQAIGSPTASGSANSISGIGGLEAQLATYQKQLSECVNCASAATPEGKVVIENLSNRILSVKTRIDELAVAKVNREVERNVAVQSIPVADSSTQAGAVTGRIVDVFA